MKKVVIVGSGAIGTAIGDVLAEKGVDEIVLLSIEDEVIRMINEKHLNTLYFPKYPLCENLKATGDKRVLGDADVVMMAIPSTAVVDYLKDNQSFLNPSALMVNLAKGFGNGDRIIPDSLADFLPNPIISLKGPSFAREIINRQDTGLTAASYDKDLYPIITDLFENTTIRTDFTTDVSGVEHASILKSIYARIIGMVDASFDSANLRSIVITKALNEMKNLICVFGGREQTMFNYCGFGDFSLTALNDMSRNRTLGLLIGKGFFTTSISDKVVLEGRIAVDVFYEKLKKNDLDVEAYPLMSELYKVFNDPGYNTMHFVKNILSK